MSDTVNISPTKESVTENNWPWLPCTSNIVLSPVDPEPCTIRPLRTLNSFAIVYFSFFIVQKNIDYKYMKNYSVIGIYKTGQGGFEHIIPDTNDPEN